MMVALSNEHEADLRALGWAIDIIDVEKDLTMIDYYKDEFTKRGWIFPKSGVAWVAGTHGYEGVCNDGEIMVWSETFAGLVNAMLDFALQKKLGLEETP